MSSKRDILEISCKVLGLVCLIWAVGAIPHAISAVVRLAKHGSSGANEPILWWLPRMIAMPVVYIVSAFLLLKCSKGIALLLIREDGPVQVEVGKDWQSSLYTLCLRVVGAVVLVRGIPQLIRILPQVIFRHRLAPPIPPTIWGELISAIVYLVLGIYFIGGAKLIARIALKGSMRESGSDNM